MRQMVLLASARLFIVYTHASSFHAGGRCCVVQACVWGGDFGFLRVHTMSLESLFRVTGQDPSRVHQDAVPPAHCGSAATPSDGPTASLESTPPCRNNLLSAFQLWTTLARYSSLLVRSWISPHSFSRPDQRKLLPWRAQAPSQPRVMKRSKSSSETGANRAPFSFQ